MKATQWIDSIRKYKKDSKTCLIDWEAINEIEELFYNYALTLNKLHTVEENYSCLQYNYESTMNELRRLKNGK